MEDNTIRAIIIAIMVFMFVITITAILLYYNAMKDNANDILDLRVDYGEVYKKEIIFNPFSVIMTGSEIKDVIRQNINRYNKIVLQGGGMISGNKEINADNIDTVLSLIQSGGNYTITYTPLSGNGLNIRILNVNFAY